jgi:hypothetical protein
MAVKNQPLAFIYIDGHIYTGTAHWRIIDKIFDGDIASFLYADSSNVPMAWGWIWPSGKYDIHPEHESAAVEFYTELAPHKQNTDPKIIAAAIQEIEKLGFVVEDYEVDEPPQGILERFHAQDVPTTDPTPKDYGTYTGPDKTKSKRFVILKRDKINDDYSVSTIDVRGNPDYPGFTYVTLINAPKGSPDYEQSYQSKSSDDALHMHDGIVKRIKEELAAEPVRPKDGETTMSGTGYSATQIRIDHIGDTTISTWNYVGKQMPYVTYWQNSSEGLEEKFQYATKGEALDYHQAIVKIEQGVQSSRGIDLPEYESKPHQYSHRLAGVGIHPNQESLFHAPGLSVVKVDPPETAGHSQGEMPFIYYRPADVLFETTSPCHHSDVYDDVMAWIAQHEESGYPNFSGDAWINGDITSPDKTGRNWIKFIHPGPIPKQLVDYFKSKYPDRDLIYNTDNGWESLPDSLIKDSSSHKLSFQSEPDKLEEFMQTIPKNGCFGYVNGHLILGKGHHQAIMGELMNHGWTWEDLFAVPQAWGWYSFISSTDPFIELQFTSDAGIQNKDEVRKAGLAFAEKFRIPITQSGNPRGILEKGNEYGEGLSGKHNIEQYLDEGQYSQQNKERIRGEIPPPPGQDFVPVNQEPLKVKDAKPEDIWTTNPHEGSIIWRILSDKIDTNGNIQCEIVSDPSGLHAPGESFRFMAGDNIFLVDTAKQSSLDKLAVAYDPEYWQEAGLPSNGCFGYIGHKLILGEKHHQLIMGKLLEAGWTWEDLFSTPQAWGWFEIIGSYRANPRIELSFTSDAGTQWPDEVTKAGGAFARLYHLPIIASGYSRGVGAEDMDDYGTGLSGSKGTAERYQNRGYFNSIKGDIPPPPNSLSTEDAPTHAAGDHIVGAHLQNGSLVRLPNYYSWNKAQAIWHELDTKRIRGQLPNVKFLVVRNADDPEWADSIPASWAFGDLKEGSIKYAFVSDPDYWKEQGLQSSGAFGFINGKMLLSPSHHQMIMGHLFNNGWDWEDLFNAPQAWGWYFIDLPNGSYNNSNHAVLYMRFTSDAGMQNDNEIPKAKAAMAQIYKLPVEDWPGRGTKGVSDEQAYGTGIRGRDFVDNYLDNGYYHEYTKRIIGEVPAPPSKTAAANIVALTDKPDVTNLSIRNSWARCFGYLNNTLYIGEGHHALILDWLTKNGYDWETLMTTPQVWGWVHQSNWDWIVNNKSKVVVYFATDDAREDMELAPAAIEAVANWLDMPASEIVHDINSEYPPPDPAMYGQRTRGIYQRSTKTATTIKDVEGVFYRGESQADEFCFGYLENTDTLYLGETHHASIIASLISEGMSWEDLMTSRQMWGWVHVYDGTYNEATDSWRNVLSLTFATDEARQDKGIRQKTIAAVKSILPPGDKLIVEPGTSASNSEYGQRAQRYYLNDDES